MGNTKTDLIFQVDQLKSAKEENYVRKNFTFEFPKGLNNDGYQAVFELGKFNIVPGI
jgi:hypothetical protein